MAGEAAMAAARALARLTVEQRGAIALCLAGGWTHQEAAEILDLPLGSVKSHIARGRARLSELLQGQDR
jgi:DNA-directed RNA polymerase specialized sigma24 family protein